MADWQTRKAQPSDLDAVKALFDAHRNELGFVMRPSLLKSMVDGELIVASDGTTLIGAVHYHHRRDGQTTLYHIAVATGYRRSGVGATLVAAMRAECEAKGKTRILLKCPADLNANSFYARLGFNQATVETGKKRSLNVWVIDSGSE